MGNRKKNRAEPLLRGLLGEIGLEALNKAIVREGPDVVADPQDLYLSLLVVPRSILAWLMSSIRPMEPGDSKEFTVPGTDGAVMLVNKMASDVYKGNIVQGGKEIHKFHGVGLPALAGHLMTVFELYDEVESSVAPMERESSVKLNELITRMVLSNMGQPAAAPTINIHINGDKVSQPQPPKSEENAEKAEVPAEATSTPPAPPKPPAAPKAPPIPKAPKSPSTPSYSVPAAPAPSMQKAGTFTVSSEEMAARCPDCGEPEFMDGKYRGCPCFLTLGKAITEVTPTKDGKYRIRFGRGWDRENVETLIRILKKRREADE